ncbi:MAG TPA: hypothetical protein VL240_14215 [Candidatus Binatia bacterium]|nr:hypothetical protein [Candidatus Binatia bacterium]
MTTHEHERAIDLITRRGTEEIDARNIDWLNAHLTACPACAQYGDDFNNTGRLLRAVAVTASPALVASTQARIRARAMQLNEQRSRMVLIAISFCLGVLFSALSGWMWWRFGGWVAARLGLSPAIVDPGILFFLVLPALVIAVLMLAFPRTALEQSMIAWAREREGENQ